MIAIGYDLIEYSPKKWNPEGTTPIIHIGTAPAEIDSSYIPLVEVVGDISDSLMDIMKKCTQPSWNCAPREASLFEVSQSEALRDRISILLNYQYQITNVIFELIYNKLMTNKYNDASSH